MTDPITLPTAGESPFARFRVSLREHAREMLQDLLRAEIDELLGASRHERTGERRGYRHGSTERTVVSVGGPTTIQAPRARIQAEDGSFEEHQSEVLPRYARRTKEVDEVLIGAYLGGMNTRKIRRALEPLLGTDSLSRSSISRVVSKLKDRFVSWMARDLCEERVVVLYLDAMFLPVRIARRVVRVPVQAAIGVRASGEKILLSLRIAPSESTAAWKGMIEDLASRGLQALQLAVVDGNAGLRRALSDTWKQTEIQRCIVHKWENLKKASPKHCHRELKRDYDAIVYAEDLEMAQKAYDAFCRKWSKLCEAAVKSLQEAGVHLLTFYRYPKSQWKNLRTTNPIERLNGEFRRRTKTQGSFRNESSALVLLWGLIAFGYISLRRIAGYRDIEQVIASREAA